MLRSYIVAGMLSLGLLSSLRAQQPVDPSRVVRYQPPADPFAQAPVGQVSGQQNPKGYLVVSNVQGNRYTYVLTGTSIKQVQFVNKENPHARIWDVDGIVLQSVPVPLAREAKLGFAQDVLLSHKQYESEHVAKGGYKEVESARKWMDTQDGPVLYWEMQTAGNQQAEKGARKMLFANAVNGRNVILFSTSIMPNVDEAKAGKLLIETARSITRAERHATKMLNPGNALTMLFNDELATREDRKGPGAMVVKPETMILLARMLLELKLEGRRPGIMTAIHDGKSGHMITLYEYEPAAKRFIYTDPLGPRSFLLEGNNRAGVKAVQATEKQGRMYAVTGSDLQLVMQAMINVPFGSQRAYFVTGSMEEAIAEYEALYRMNPKAIEVSETFLLKAAQILIDGKENARAVNLYGTCNALYPNSSRALAGFANVYARIGRIEPSLNFYRDAIKKLPQDPSLTPEQRNLLIAYWSTARDALPVKGKK